MKHIKLFLLIALLAYYPAKSDAQDTPIIKFGLIADAQYGDCETSGTRFYRNSLKKIDDCLADLENENLDFYINLGDIIDRDFRDMDSILIHLAPIKSKIYHTTGNHDYKNIDDNNLLYDKLGMPSEYYAFRKDNWVFVMLNTNEVASYANIKGTEKENELTMILENIAKKGKKNGQSYNGGISRKQMNWLADLLKEADRTGNNVLIFTHHPLYPESGFTALNDTDILNLLSNHPCVKAVFSGHHHTGAFGIYRRLPCITVEGMIETENENAYGIVEIYPDQILLKGKERMKSHTIKLE